MDSLDPTQSNPPRHSPWRMPGRRSSYRRNTPDAVPSEWWLDQSIGTFKKGDLILNRFEIQKCIGRGGMSLVYHAKDRNRQEDVALKFLSPALLLEPDAKDRFRNEARISIRLQHPGILRVFEIHEDQGIHFLSMELLRGENLRERLIRWKGENREVSVDDVINVIKPVAEALAYAHLHTVHRDIKPENIGIDQDGKVYLMDFGLAEALRPGNSERQRHTLSYVKVGTPYYMAPEQIKLPGKGDALSDQFSLAVVAYEMFTGEVPLGLSRPLSERLPPQFSQLGNIIDRALATNPLHRFPNVQSFQQAIDENAASKFNFHAWRHHHHRAIQVGIVTLVATCFMVGIWFTLSLVNRRLETANKDFERARSLLANTDQMITRLATELGETRSEATWLQKEFSLEQRAWNSGITNHTQWIKLLSISNDLAEATFVWSQFRSRLTPSNLPLSVATLQRHGDLNRQSLRADKLLSSASVLSNEVTQSKKELRDLEQRLRQTHRQQRLRDQLERLNTGLPGSSWVQSSIKELESLSSPDDFDSLQLRFSSQVASRLESTKESLNQWNILFGQEGAPDLSFLGSPTEAIERATFLSKEGDYASAIITLQSAQKLLTGWITDLQNLHRHSNQSWEKAANEGSTIETEMGMRFIKHEGLYWSVWETRVMDFARYLQEFPERSIVIGDYWKNPPYPQGPTHPVVGIDQETASHFATWVAYRIRSKFNSAGSLPTTEQWENLLEKENPNPRMALYPNRTEWSSNHFALYYSDPELKPERYTKPVGMSPPEANGLFDLSGNLWEWCADLYEFPSRFRNTSEPDTWTLMGGNPFQQTSYQSFAPPDPNIIWVIQKHTIGFRIILSLR